MNRKVMLACSSAFLALATATVAWRSSVSSSARVSRGPIGRLSPAAARLEGEPQSNAVHTSFQVVNDGDADLILEDPSSSCSCTVSSLTPRILRPGESATGSIEAQTPTSGERVVEVKIPTNATTAADGTLRFRLLLVGNRTPPFVTSSPSTFQLGETSANPAPTEARVETCEAAGTPPWIGSAQSSLPSFEVTGGLVSERSQDGEIVVRDYTFRVAPTSPLKVGDVWGEVRLLSSDPNGGIVHTLPIRGRILPRVYARPSRLFARGTPDAPTPPLRFSVVAADPSFELKVEPLEWPRDQWDVQAAGGTSSRRDFTVIPRPNLNRNSEAALTLSTNDPDVPQIVVPVTLFGASSSP